MNLVLNIFRKIFGGSRKAKLAKKKGQGKYISSNIVVETKENGKIEVPKKLFDFKTNLEPDPEDARDYKFIPSPKKVATNLAKARSPTKLTSYDLRQFYKFSVVKNQGSIGSCQSFAAAGIMEALHNSPNIDENYDLSELFLYYISRKEGKIQGDGGAYLRDVCKVLARDGVTLETYWPYIPSKYDVQPSWEAYFAARFLKIKRYERVMTVKDIYAAVLSGKPALFGMQVPTSFMNYSKGVYKISSDPKVRAKDQIVGGHAMVIVGYEGDAFIVRNSWGSSWGENGYCRISEETLTLLFMDAWVMYLK